MPAPVRIATWRAFFNAATSPSGRDWGDVSLIVISIVHDLASCCKSISSIIKVLSRYEEECRKNLQYFNQPRDAFQLSFLLDSTRADQSGRSCVILAQLWHVLLFPCRHRKITDVT